MVKVILVEVSEFPLANPLVKLIKLAVGIKIEFEFIP
jgi:hypothetical protein